MKNTTTNKKCSDNSRGNKKVTRAAKEYLDRKLRTSHPDGIFDSVGRFNLSAKEKYDCCLGIRAPSRNYKYTEMLHARSALH
ncbi:MAG: hypothetical protein HAW67_00280, partial [Endozoicomonadaceae bacterium]|nr:hypothetical protein [Endozoicomonadaceae bacterium]